MRKMIITTLIAVCALVLGTIAMEELPTTPVTIQDALTLCQQWVSENRMLSAHFNVTSAVLKTGEDGKEWWEVTYTKRRLMNKGDKPGFMVLKVAMDKMVDRIQNEK